MRRETEKTFAQVTMALLIVLTSISLFIGLCAVTATKPLNYEYIFIVLLTGVLPVEELL